MYPLTKAQYTSMAKMRALAPKMAQLKERFGDDRQKMSQATMEMYRKEKVNPAGGCLPLIVQMPIFLALYWVFLESVELRHAPFMLWIQDLSAQGPILYTTYFNGCKYVCYAKNATNDSSRSDATKNNAIYASSIYCILLLVPFRSCTLLVSK